MLALLAGVSVSFALASCGSDSDDAEDDAAPTAGGLPEDMDPEGSLVFSYPLSSATLDPHKGGLGPILVHVYDTLTTITPDSEVEPRLASSWSFPDAKTLELQLRDDVTFHDGTKFDAEAVRFSLNRAKTVPGSLVASSLAGIQTIEVVNPTTVKLHLSAGGAELPAVFAANAGMMISPKAGDADLNNGGGDFGSAPWKVTAWASLDKATLELAQEPGEHWDEAAGLIRHLTVNYVPNGTQRLNAVMSKDIDLAQITSSDIVAAKRALDAKQVQGVTHPTSATPLYFQMRTTRPPFDNLKFRQALQFAIDRDSLNAGVYGGTCTKNDQIYPASHWSYNKDLANKNAFNASKAKSLITESGVQNPSFSMTYLPIYDQPANALQGLLKEIGIDMKLTPLPAGDRSFIDGNVDAQYGTLTSPPDPSAALTATYLPVSLLRLMPDPTGSFTAAAAKAADPSLSQDERAPLYKDIWKTIMDTSVVVPICTGSQAWVHTGQVGNLDKLIGTQSGALDLRYLYVKE
jgi:peptide/nickel transport system substrate-binding protein